MVGARRTRRSTRSCGQKTSSDEVSGLPPCSPQPSRPPCDCRPPIRYRRATGSWVIVGLNGDVFMYGLYVCLFDSIQHSLTHVSLYVVYRPRVPLLPRQDPRAVDRPRDQQAALDRQGEGAAGHPLGGRDLEQLQARVPGAYGGREEVSRCGGEGRAYTSRRHCRLGMLVW